jgi:LPS-assembly lipoprotein
MQANRPFTPTFATRRRALLQLAAGAAAFAGVSGCGFKLRQAPTFAFQTVRFASAASTPVAYELQKALITNGLKVVSGAAPADVVLTVITDQRERIAVGQTAAGQVRELQLRTRFTFRLRTATDKDLIENTELLIERELSFNETVVLSKASEEELLYRDMLSDAVQQVVRRLAAVKSL